METVYKYPLKVADWQEVALPFGAQILFVEVQNGGLYLWAKVNTQEPDELVTIRMAGTGHDLRARGGVGNFEYINSIFMHNRSLVFHFFKVTNPKLSPTWVDDPVPTTAESKKVQDFFDRIQKDPKAAIKAIAEKDLQEAYRDSQ